MRGAPGGPKSWPARPFSTCGCRADDTWETAPSVSLRPPPWGGFWQGSGAPSSGGNLVACPRGLCLGGWSVRGNTTGCWAQGSHPGDRPGREKQVDPRANYR